MQTAQWLMRPIELMERCARRFAMFEMKIAIPVVLRAFALRSASTGPERMRRRAITFVPEHDALVVAERRTERLGSLDSLLTAA